MYEACRDAGRRPHDGLHVPLRARRCATCGTSSSSGALGTPRHFRSQRFLDWPETSWGWRQYKDKAGAGDLYDMTIHRIDFAIDLLGPIARVSGAVARFAPRTTTPDGKPCPPSERRRLVGRSSASSPRAPPASGRGPPWRRATTATVSATSGPRSTARRAPPSTACTSRTRSCSARRARTSRPSPSRPSSSSRPAAPATPRQGEPATVFRYDLVWEFISAIVEGRPAVPSFHDGLNAQIVADAVLESHEKRTWVETPLAVP